MPAQNIKEAVEKGTKGLLADYETLIMELRDFFAHACQNYENKVAINGSYLSLTEFFYSVFKDYPAFRSDSNDEEPFEDMRIQALKAGEKIANCKCSETVPMMGRVCDYCRQEQLKDANFCDHILEMLEE